MKNALLEYHICYYRFPFLFYDGQKGWIEVISTMRNEKYTQESIGEKIGWSREKVRDYYSLLNVIGANILDMAKIVQKGRAPEKGANAPMHNFTEGWFRNSGLYQLDELYQELLIDSFIVDKCKWNNNNPAIDFRFS